MPMLLARGRRGPRPCSSRATTVRPQTRAQAVLRSQVGTHHLRSTWPSQAWPMRSNAFSWPTRVTAGQ
eukprot:717814-Lingulodinium_polyedra.AAC.1